MIAYYAHCQTIYNTPQEERDITELQNAGFAVVNPNRPEHKEKWERFGMAYAEHFASNCDLIVFRALPSGEIPAGIAKEIDLFVARRKPVLELPSIALRRVLDVAHTRLYLHEIGQR